MNLLLIIRINKYIFYLCACVCVCVLSDIMPTAEKKFVIVGDGESGKTCLLHVFFEDVYPDVYVPTAFDCFTTVVEVDGKRVKLSLWDTAGQEDYDRLRPLSYPGSDVVIICYSIDVPESLANVTEKWLPEVRYFCKDVPIILVGNKKDLREQLATDRVVASPVVIGGRVQNDDDDDNDVCAARRENSVVERRRDDEDGPVVSRGADASLADGYETDDGNCKLFMDNVQGPDAMLNREQGETVAEEIGAVAFFECSAKTREGVRDVFVAAVKTTRCENKQCVLF